MVIGKRCRPAVVHLPEEVQAPAVDVGVVPAVLEYLRVVEAAPGQVGAGGVRCLVDAVEAVPVRGMAEHVVDEAAIVIVVAREAQRQRVLHERHVEDQRATVAHVALIAAAHFAVEDGFVFVQSRLVREDAHRAGLRVGAVQASLRARQRLDAGNVDRADIRLRAGLGNRDLVEVDGRRCLAEVAGARNCAAEDDGVAARAVIDDVDRGNESGVVVQSFCPHCG